MRIKRLEPLLGRQLIARQERGIKLTVHGKELLDYGRQILGINDEVWNRMTHEAFKDKLVIGVPPDILYPHIPRILREFSDAFPHVEVNLISTRTVELKEEFAKGKLDFILTIESETAKGGQKLVSHPLKWFCQRGNNQIWKKRPLPLAYEQRCIFLKHATDSLDAENTPRDLAFVCSKLY
jgi:DNA-binding transcriptional LysR family regulator